MMTKPMKTFELHYDPAFNNHAYPELDRDGCNEPSSLCAGNCFKLP